MGTDAARAPWQKGDMVVSQYAHAHALSAPNRCRCCLWSGGPHLFHSTTTWEPAQQRGYAPLRAMRENTPHPASVHTQAAIGRNNPSPTRGPKGRGSLDRTATKPPKISLTQW